MKVKINLKVGKEEDVTFSLKVNEADTPTSVKERVAVLQPIPFPDQELMFAGQIIQEGMKLCDCEVKNGSSLDLVVKASESALINQLKDLLQPRDLSCDELGMLYSYKHGASISQAFKAIGFDGKLGDFIAGQKTFLLTGNGLVSQKSQQQKPQKDGPAPSCDAGKSATQAGLSVPPKSAVGASTSSESQQYHELHDEISSRSFNSRAMQALNFMVDVLMETSFLNIDHIVKGGSVGKGTAITSCADAELVCFVSGLPAAAHDKWLQPMLKAVAAILTTNSNEIEAGFESVDVADDAVCVKARGITTHVRFASVFESYDATIEELRERMPEGRRFLDSSLAMERTQFIARQPGHVKVTIRLLKWWRDQQTWSSKMVRPSDEILELMAVYSAVQTKPADQRMAIANVMILLSRFNELRIVWSNYYTKDCIWEPLLSHRPLLMDPVNPFVNVADPQCFDPRELMAVAKTTHFFC